MATAERVPNLSDQIGVLLEALELSGNERAVRAALRQFSQAAGLKRFAYVGVSGDSVRTLTDLPVEWEDRYLGEQFAIIDPVVGHAKRSLKPFSWAFSAMEIAENEVKAYCADIGDVGVASGITVPYRAGFGRTAMLTFMTDDHAAPEVSVKALQRAVAAVAYTHLYVSQPDFAASRTLGHSLTPRELACVMWTSLGKKKSEIAQMLGVSEKTVRFHLENARAKLGATNGAHMVRLAFLAGIMPLR